MNLKLLAGRDENFIKKWKKTKDPMDRQRFETSRREVNNLSITKRKEYFSKCISESSNSQRDLYNICIIFI